MGVPGLYSDLLPYSNLLTLGSAVECSNETPQITKVIIDGPSMVYHIYHKLLSYKASTCPATSLALLPAYSEVNSGIECFLEDLSEHGLEVVALFFDGVLPRQKRDVRLRRLDQTRERMMQYRRSNTQPKFAPCLQLTSTGDFHGAVWHKGVLPFKLNLPPEPPFIVASAIEALKASHRWNHRVFIVPEEADVACARACASTQAAAVLSNDSDLTLYRLGAGNILMFLHSLESRLREPAHQNLQALTIDPAKLAEQLRLPSLLRLGFERYLDPNCSTKTIIQRARSGSQHSSGKCNFNEFVALYEVPSSWTKLEIGTGLDPRLAELVAQINEDPESDEAFPIYLPTLLEDPDRESSWMYGLELRQLAYSFLLPGRSLCVQEHFRKSVRITTSTVTPLSASDVRNRVSLTLKSMQLIFSNSSQDTPTSTEEDTILCWWMLAFHFVVKQKLSMSKIVHPKSIASLFVPLRGSAKTPVSWEDLHLHSNAQAVLYAFRMLKQVMQLESASMMVEDVCGQQSRDLQLILDTMPSLAKLFVDIPHLRQMTESLTAANGRLESIQKLVKKHTTGGSSLLTDNDDNGRSNVNHNKRASRPAATPHRKPPSGNLYDLLPQD